MGSVDEQLPSPVVDRQRELVAAGIFGQLDDVELADARPPTATRPRRAPSARYGTAATWSTAFASGSTSLAFLDDQDAGKRNEAGVITVDALRLDRHDASHSRALGTPWMPVSIQPGGPGSWTGSTVHASLAGKLLVERLAPPEEPHC